MRAGLLDHKCHSCIDHKMSARPWSANTPAKTLSWSSPTTIEHDTHQQHLSDL